jgi:predicted metal-dependent HD superfamily phosphohydrolase
MLPAWVGVTSATPAAQEVGVDLLRRYAEPHRRYHTGAHLAAVLAHIDDLAGWADDPRAVRLAAWFHDAVYDPLRTDNELRSAGLAERVLPPLGLDHALTSRVARLVRLTAGHAPDAGDTDGAVLCDADLAVLAGSPRTYAAYVDAVRAEYAALDDVTWRRGRGDVVRTLLLRDPLYRTPPAHAGWTDRARANLTGELAALALS